MANWCENDLAVEGPKEVIGGFLQFAAGESAFDFNHFIPSPAERRRLDDIDEEWCVTNWGTKWPACRVRVEGPFARYDEKTVEVVLHFDTAWSPPKPVIARAAELYPALRFELRYFESGCQFNGLLSYSGGECESDESGPYFGARGG